MSTPFFSVCIPQFNRTSFLIEACKVLNGQTFRDFEICISDDCSTDGRETELIQYLQQSGLSFTYKKQPKNKRYDANLLREKLLRRNIFPWICRRKKPGQVVEKIESVLRRTRWKVERAISWLQRKFRRLAVRWERRARYWRGFLTFGLVVFWINRLVR